MFRHSSSATAEDIGLRVLGAEAELSNIPFPSTLAPRTQRLWKPNKQLTGAY